MAQEASDQKYRVVMRARFQSPCLRCDDPIRAGQQMTIIPGLGNHHTACAPSGLPGEVMRRGSEWISARQTRYDLKEQRIRVAHHDNQERVTY